MMKSCCVVVVVVVVIVIQVVVNELKVTFLYAFANSLDPGQA